MAAGLRLTSWTDDRRGGHWVLLAMLMLAGAVLLRHAPADALQWQPGLAWREPWRWWTAALVHRSDLHLLANAAGAVVVAWFGRRAGCSRGDALAWLAAWPLTQLLLALDPRAGTVAGLSGVLHAGVAVAALPLLWRDGRRPRLIGALVLAGLLLKLLAEAAWQAPLRAAPEWGFPVAIVVHATGAAAGLLCAGVAGVTGRLRGLGTMRR